MSILDKVGIRNDALPFKRPEDPHGVEIQMATQQTHTDPYHNGYTYETAFLTEVRIKTQWYANQAQFNDRYAIARKEMLYFMYGPVLDKLNAIMARAYDRDYREVIRLVDEIQKELVE